MKKFLSIVLMILLVLSPVINVEAATTTSSTTKATTSKKTTTKKTTTEKTSEKETEKEGKRVKIHLFYASWCGYCKALHEYLAELAKDPTYGPMFELVDYEVDTDSYSAELKEEVDTYFDHAGNGGVPVYVIGDEYFDGYAAESYNDRIKKAIKDAYESGKTFNKVEKLAENLGKENNTIGYVILGVFAVIIIAVIVSSSKNKYYEEEADKEAEVKKETATTEVKEEKVESTAKNETTEKTKTSKTTKKKQNKSTKKTK